MRKFLIYTPREVVECIVLAALFSAPVWCAALVEGFN